MAALVAPTVDSDPIVELLAWRQFDDLLEVKAGVKRSIGALVKVIAQRALREILLVWAKRLQ